MPHGRGAPKSQKTVVDPLKLELKAFVGCPMWVLRT